MGNKIFLGKYRISVGQNGVSPDLRHGCAGVTYEAEEIATGEKVAMELIPAASLKMAVRTQLEVEAFAAKQLSHINFPKLHDFGLEDDQLVYVTEYFDGTTVEAWVAAHGPMPIDAVLRIALQVVSVLGAAAFHKIFHHAINPGNLMIVPGQTVEGDWPLVKVLHFNGVAPIFFSASNLSTARFDSSATFASPEQLEHGEVDFRSEIFSLGCTLWFLLTGVAPFAAPDDPEEMAPTRMSLAVERLEGIPKQVRRLLAQTLAINPEERQLDPIVLEANIRECLTELEQEAISSETKIRAAPETRTVAAPVRRGFPAKTLALAAVLLLVATIAAMMARSFRPRRIVLQALDRPAPIGVPIGIPEEKTKPAMTQDGSGAQSESLPNELSAASGVSVGDRSTTETGVDVIPKALGTPPAAASANQIAATPRPSRSLNASLNASPAQRPAPLMADELATVTKRAQPVTSAEGPDQAATPPAEVSSGIVSANGATPVPRPLPDPSVSATAAEDTKDVAATDSTPSGPSAVISSSPEDRKIVPDPASRARAKARRLARAKRNRPARVEFALDEPEGGSDAPQFARGVPRARFVGTTPDGRWMLALPSHEVIVVPPPPRFSPVIDNDR